MTMLVDEEESMTSQGEPVLGGDCSWRGEIIGLHGNDLTVSMCQSC